MIPTPHPSAACRHRSCSAATAPPPRRCGSAVAADRGTWRATAAPAWEIADKTAMLNVFNGNLQGNPGKSRENCHFSGKFIGNHGKYRKFPNKIVMPMGKSREISNKMAESWKQMGSKWEHHLNGLIYSNHSHPQWIC